MTAHLRFMTGLRQVSAARADVEFLPYSRKSTGAAEDMTTFLTNRWVQLTAGILCMVMISSLQHGWGANRSYSTFSRPLFCNPSIAASSFCRKTSSC